MCPSLSSASTAVASESSPSRLINAFCAAADGSNGACEAEGGGAPLARGVVLLEWNTP